LFRLAIRALMNHSGLFEGNKLRFFSYDVDQLTSGKYRLAGQLVALSIRYDGPGPQCLHPAVYKEISQQSPTADMLAVEDLPDGEMKVCLRQVCLANYVLPKHSYM
jgi:hypothetical protein